jgi:hypothetical protein
MLQLREYQLRRAVAEHRTREPMEWPVCMGLPRPGNFLISGVNFPNAQIDGAGARRRPDVPTRFRGVKNFKDSSIYDSLAPLRQHASGRQFYFERQSRGASSANNFSKRGSLRRGSQYGSPVLRWVRP